MPVWAAAIGAVGGYLQSRSSKKDMKKATAQQDRLFGVQADTAEMLQPYISQYYEKAGQAFDPAFNYWNRIMQGNRSELTSAFAPEIRDTQNRFRATRENMMNLMPRGGARAARLAEQPFEERDAIQMLFNNARAAAPGEMGKLSALAGTLGAGAGGVSINAGGVAGQMGMNSAALRNAYNQQMGQTYDAIGAAMAEWWKSRKSKGEG